MAATMQIANPFSGLSDIITENEPLGPNTWYRIGGPARWFVKPRSVEDLRAASIRCVENDIPIYVLGLGANLLVGDQGVNGAVFRLEEEHWRTVKYEGNLVHALIHAADIQDRDGAPLVLAEIVSRFPWLHHVFADGGYAGTKLKDALRRISKWTIAIVKRSGAASALGRRTDPRMAQPKPPPRQRL